MENDNSYNALEWWYSQPLGEWLLINDIPTSIFYSIFNNYIEKSNVVLHRYLAEYKITKR